MKAADVQGSRASRGRRIGGFVVLLAAGLAATGAAGAGGTAVATSQPVLGARGTLPTSVQAYGFEGGPESETDLALRRIKAAGATAVRLTLYWRSVAPAGTTKPPYFIPTNPTDPLYHWGAFDRQVSDAVSHGLEPLVTVLLAPEWAERYKPGAAGTGDPDPSELGAFAQAAATRYSGLFPGLPRVRYWQVWNEPNLGVFLSPQRVDGHDVAPYLYRGMVNAFASGVHAVQRDALVIAGGQSAFGGVYETVPSIAPLRFMREMLCMGGRKAPHPVCDARASFDVWSHHPYTAGDPGHHAYYADDISLPDLPDMRRLLLAAVRAKHVVSTRPPLFWVSEFSWDTSPPDPNGVPARLHARWVAEALYRMWTYGVSLVSWFQLRDDPMSTSIFQSGLYYNDGPGYTLDRPKPALAAFRFPFVAFKRSHGVFVWGRVPPSALGKRVAVQQTIGLGWQTRAVVRPRGSGIFSATLRTPRAGSLRARIAHGPTSVAFSLKVPPKLQLISPFGR